MGKSHTIIIIIKDIIVQKFDSKSVQKSFLDITDWARGKQVYYNNNQNCSLCFTIKVENMTFMENNVGFLGTSWMCLYPFITFTGHINFYGNRGTIIASQCRYCCGHSLILFSKAEVYIINNMIVPLNMALPL